MPTNTRCLRDCSDGAFLSRAPAGSMKSVRMTSVQMKSVHVRAPGGPEVLSLVERPVLLPGPGEVLIRVAAAAVNRPDVQQRRGLYPPPPGASAVLGLDVAGVIDRVAPDVDWPRPGEAVCALANGGGYAEFCSVPAVQCMPIPKGFDFVDGRRLCRRRSSPPGTA